MFGGTTLPDDILEADVTILTYHDLGYEPGNPMVITPELFDTHLTALTAAGYETVSLAQLMAFAEWGEPLPDKPLLITFDDGYLSNYELAFPLLQAHGMKAVIFAIGHSAGRGTYKDTGIPIRPRFSWEQARAMEASGLVEVQSHSYDMHQSEDIEGDSPAFRPDMLRRPWETEDEYIAALTADWQQMRQHAVIIAVAYPHGRGSPLSDAVLQSLGIRATFTTRPGVNAVAAGLPQGLMSMDRFTVPGGTGAAELLEMIAVHAFP
jgi:peptidoglycan/xylan/chitin deacetylase (PgdA/CDA1 family)